MVFIVCPQHWLQIRLDWRDKLVSLITSAEPYKASPAERLTSQTTQWPNVTTTTTIASLYGQQPYGHWLYRKCTVWLISERSWPKVSELSLLKLSSCAPGDKGGQLRVKGLDVLKLVHTHTVSPSRRVGLSIPRHCVGTLTAMSRWS